MKIESQRFGAIEVKEDRILHLKGGLLGFNQNEKYVILDDSDDPALPFKWLVAVEDPETGFLVTDPGLFFNDYVFDLPETDGKELALGSSDDVHVLVLLTVPSDPKMITANLLGPIVVNAKNMTGKQIVLHQTNYTTKHYIFLQATESQRKEDSTAAAATASIASPAFEISPEAAAREMAKHMNMDIKPHA